jgi:RNA polymerase sigma factor (sigma-70 family)
VVADYDLLEAWAGGDRVAGNQLFEEHFQAVYRFFRNKISDGAEDLVQQTFLACMESRDSFRRESNFRTFLFAVARNILFNEYRRRRRKECPRDLTTTTKADPRPSPPQGVAGQAEQRVMLEALRRIPLDYQIALELYMWEGLTGPELAEVLGIGEPGVRSRLRRAKESLRKQVEELAESPEVLASTVSDLDDWAASLRDVLDAP